MDSTSHEPSPFEGFHEDPRDKAPQPKTASQLASGVTGFLLMGVGGAAMALGFVMNQVQRRAGWLIVLGIGAALCSGGFALFNWSRSRRRRK